MPGLERLTVQCCVAGGGPAGVMLGFLLARAGVDVVVLEKHEDFFRDFRGDTIHPSTLELMRELGVLDAFLKLPHQNAATVGVRFDQFEVTVADFTRLPTHCKFIALMPQWDFLDFLAELGTRYRTFSLRMGTEATGIIEEYGRVAGVRAESPAGRLEVRADLVVAADGRHSTIREAARFEVDALSAPMDVLWFRLPRQPADPQRLTFFVASGRLLIMIDRGDYWQMGYVISKGSLEALKAAGIEPFRRDLDRMAPFLRGRTAALRSWDDVKLLSVRVDCLRQWYRPGLLCIGDAAHAMSPIGGVGVNLAVQDAVATANILAGALKHGRPTIRPARSGPASPRVPRPADAEGPGPDSRQHHRPTPGRHASAEAAVRGPAPTPYPVLAKDSRTFHRYRHPAGTCHDRRRTGGARQFLKRPRSRGR